MNFLNKTMLIVATILLFIACDQNDDVPSPVNKFTVAGIDYETTNCYVEFDEDNPPHEFNLFFLNAIMSDGDGTSQEYLFSETTFNWVFYNIRDVENPSITTPFYPNIQTGVAYTGGVSDTVIVANATVGDDNSGTNFSNTASPTITINSWVFDNTTQTGTINVDYVWGPVTGHYEGTVGVILD